MGVRQIKVSYKSLIIMIAFLTAGCITIGSQEAEADVASYQPVTAMVNQKTVTRYIPVDVMGQLMPVPKINQAVPPDLTAQAAVDAADKEATVVPNSTDFVNSTMTYNYMPGEIYTIYTAPMKITDVVLAPGEKLISEAAGDTLRWQIASTYSGNVSDETQHILIKPSAVGLENTMVITTDQHVYHLILQSTQDTYMASVQWNYPGNMINISPQSQPPAPDTGDTSSNIDSSALASLDFNYIILTVKGWRPDWYPLRAFNNGKETYIQMPKGYSAIDLPQPYISSSGSTASSANWQYQPPYIVVDAVVPKIRLQNATGVPGKTIVEVDQTDAQ